MGASIFTTEGRELNRWSDRLVSAEDWVCVPCLETLLFNARSLQNTQKNARSLAFHPAKWEMSKICRHLIPAAHWCLTWWTFPAGHIFPLQGRPPGGEDLLALSHRKGEAGIWKKQLSYQLDANAFRYPLGIYWLYILYPRLDWGSMFFFFEFKFNDDFVNMYILYVQSCHIVWKYDLLCSRVCKCNETHQAFNSGWVPIHTHTHKHWHWHTHTHTQMWTWSKTSLDLILRTKNIS